VKVLLTGADGQAGNAVRDSKPGWADLVPCTRKTLDITEIASVREVLADSKPDWIINTAAYTDVDGAETDVARAESVNILGPRNLATVAVEIGAKIVHLSTDYVFDGESSEPLLPDATTAPINVYGRTKRDGELCLGEILGPDAIVIRTSWLYYKVGRNFVTTMLKLMRSRDRLSIVDDQTGSPTWGGSLAPAIWTSIEKQLNGIHHWRDAGVANWFEFATAIAEIGWELGLLEREVEIIPVPSSSYLSVARRPRIAVLDTARTEAELGMKAQDWKVNLRTMLTHLKGDNFDA